MSAIRVLRCCDQSASQSQANDGDKSDEDLAHCSLLCSQCHDGRRGLYLPDVAGSATWYRLYQITPLIPMICHGHHRCDRHDHDSDHRTREVRMSDSGQPLHGRCTPRTAQCPLRSESDPVAESLRNDAMGQQTTSLVGWHPFSAPGDVAAAARHTIICAA